MELSKGENDLLESDELSYFEYTYILIHNINEWHLAVFAWSSNITLQTSVGL